MMMASFFTACRWLQVFTSVTYFWLMIWLVIVSMLGIVGSGTVAPGVTSSFTIHRVFEILPVCTSLLNNLDSLY